MLSSRRLAFRQVLEFLVHWCPACTSSDVLTSRTYCIVGLCGGSGDNKLRTIAAVGSL